jgi:YD repeat-containing protein
MPTSGHDTDAKTSRFWHPPLWKWGVVFLLVACSAFLFFRKPSPTKVELLPFTNTPPAWNGSYPYLVISPVDPGSGHIKLKTSIQLIEPTVHHDSPVNEFQVDLHSGMFVLRQTDLFIADVMPLSLTRTYRVWDSYSRAFGAGANHPYDICPTGTRRPYTYMQLNLEDDRPIYLRRISKGTGYEDAVFRHEKTSSEFYGLQVAWNGDGWTMKFLDGSRFLFPEAYYSKNYAQGAVYDMQDAAGHHIQLKRDARRNLQKLISPSGRTITFKYDDADRIIEAADEKGNVRAYSYDTSGHLQSVSDASHPLYRFEYTPSLHLAGYDPYLMTAIYDHKGRELLRNIYNESDGGRISEQRLANGDVYRYEYILVGHDVVKTIVDGPMGQRRFFFQDGILKREEWGDSGP